MQSVSYLGGFIRLIFTIIVLMRAKAMTHIITPATIIVIIIVFKITWIVDSLRKTYTV